MNNIFNEFNKTSMVFDRSPSDVFEFPYSWESIEIQPNELAVASTLNLKLEKLYYNLLYLYGLCNIPDFVIPNEFLGWFGLSGIPAIPSNLLSYSEILTATSFWQASGLTITKNNALNPLLTYGTYNLDEGSSTNYHYLCSAPIAVSADTYYAFSAYFKNVNKRHIQLTFSPDGFNKNCYANFDLVTVAVTGYNCEPNIRYVGNNWYRFGIIAKTETASKTQTPKIVFYNNIDTESVLPIYTGANESANVFGVQVEQGYSKGMYNTPPIGSYVATSGSYIPLPSSDMGAYLASLARFYTTKESLSNSSCFLTAGNFGYLANTDVGYAYLHDRYKIPLLAIGGRDSFTIIGFSSDFKAYQYTNQTLTDPPSGSLTFKSISDITSNGDTNLYVVDSELNNVYNFDVYETIGTDNLKRGRTFLNNFIGGLGGLQDKFKFNYPNKLTFTGSELIVEDTGNKCFKVYDKNLNWLNTVYLRSLFDVLSGSRLTSMAYNSKRRLIYATDRDTLYLLNYATDYNILSSNSYCYKNIFVPEEYIVDIEIADYEEDIFYIFTNKNIYKKWITEPEKNIGIYSSSKDLNNNEIKWGISTVCNTSADFVFVFNTVPSLTSDSIAVYRDGLNLISTVQNPYMQIYDFDDIKIVGEEYNQAWIYNKAFKKLFYNILLFTQNIGYRFFYGEGANQAPIFIEKKYNDYFTKDVFADIDTFANVCVNENFQAATVNRVLKKIYDYQYTILTSIVSPESIKANLSPKSITPTNKMFDVYYYYQGDGITISPDGAKLYTNIDNLTQLNPSLKVVSVTPYLSGDGITII